MKLNYFRVGKMRQPHYMHRAHVYAYVGAPLQKEKPRLDHLNVCKDGRLWRHCHPQPNPPLQLPAERGQDGSCPRRTGGGEATRITMKLSSSVSNEGGKTA